MDEPRPILSNRADEAHSPTCTGDRRSLIGPLPAPATLELRRRDSLSRTNDILDYTQNTIEETRAPGGGLSGARTMEKFIDV